MEELAAKYRKMENEEDETTAVASRYAQTHIALKILNSENNSLTSD